jgi:hypothetical protein
MSGIFDYIDSVLYKNENLVIDERNVEFNGYMLNRWLSMYSPEIANVVNESSNRLFASLTTKQEQYDFLYNLLPKCKRKRIEYIKKLKEEDREFGDMNIDNIAYNMELSKKEVIALLDSLDKLNK